MTGNTPPPRLILHVDMDAFYASVEQLDDAALRGRPVIVGGLGARGVVSTASYEARRFGVHSAMPMYEARRRCPEGVFLPVRMARYRALSQRVFAEFSRLTPVVEGLSLDEAFLDLTGAEKLHGAARDIGRELKRRIHAATGLAASVGIGPNKFLAKLATELGKPDGLCEISAATARETLSPLPIERLWGIGRKTAERLRELGFERIGQIRDAPPAQLQPVLGRSVHHYQRLAAGLDDRQVATPARERSISSEVTFSTDVHDPAQLERTVLEQADTVAARLRGSGVTTACLVLKLRTPDFRTHTRSRSFSPPRQDTDTLRRIALALLAEWRRQHPDSALRLLGLGATRLQQFRQMGLFGSENRTDSAVDAIRERFGPDALRRGRRPD